MSTSSYIGKVLADGSVQAIRCHWDGQLNRATLEQHYTDEAKIDALLALSEVSEIGPEIGEAHDFNNPRFGWCIAYHRDRGEELQPLLAWSSVYACLASAIGAGIAYVYLWNGAAWQTHQVFRGHPRVRGAR